MNNKLSLINYVLKYKDDKVNDIIDFIINYEKVLTYYFLEGLEIDGENKNLTNYILTYLNDDITDSNIYRLCLDLAIFISNYSKVIDRFHKINNEENEINIKKLIKM